MTRVKISAAIIILIAAMSLFSGIWLESCCRELMERADRAAEYFDEGCTGACINTAEELEAEWQSFRRAASVIMRSSKLSDIDRICARITATVRSGSDPVPDLAELRRMLEKLR